LTCLKECYIHTLNTLVCKQYGWPRYFRLWIWRWRPIIDAVLKTWNPTMSYIQQCTKLIIIPTLKVNFSYILSKLKRTRSQTTSDLYILNWKSSCDVTLFMCQSRSTIFRGILICVIFRPRDSHIVYKQVYSAYEYSIPSGMSTADLTAFDSQWKYALHYNCIRIIVSCSMNYIPICVTQIGK
jgi:hypothetical protein